MKIRKSETISRTEVWFWQTIISPHMTGLADELSKLGFVIKYVATSPITKDRLIMGWEEPDMINVNLYIASDQKKIIDLISIAPKDSIHICQGVRGNGLVGVALKNLRKNNMLIWVIMEMIDQRQNYLILKKIYYFFILNSWKKFLQGILSIGYKTPQWLEDRGFPGDKIFPFAYFLPQKFCLTSRQNKTFKFLFVGQLIQLKNIELLLYSLAELTEYDYELVILGDGPLRNKLSQLSAKLIDKKVRWLGVKPMSLVPQEMANSDCLVLPSSHDGWGAVVSEALIIGTQCICSDACGSSEIVNKIGYGGVFKNGDIISLKNILKSVLQYGTLKNSDRKQISKRAKVITSKVGAKYLKDIILSKKLGDPKPSAPWDI